MKAFTFAVYSHSLVTNMSKLYGIVFFLLVADYASATINQYVFEFGKNYPVFSVALTNFGFSQIDISRSRSLSQLL